MGNHPKTKIAFIVSLVLIAARLLAFYLGLDYELIDTIFLFLFLSALIPLCLYAIWPHGENWNFYGDLIKSLRLTILYGVVISGFLYLFYSFVEVSYFPQTRAAIIQAQIQEAPEADVNEIRRNIESFFSVRNFSVLLMVLFAVLSVFYSVLFSALKRVLIKGKK